MLRKLLFLIDFCNFNFIFNYVYRCVSAGRKTCERSCPRCPESWVGPPKAGAKGGHELSVVFGNEAGSSGRQAYALVSETSH